MSSNNAVELKGGMYTFLSLRLLSDDLDRIDTALADKVQQAPAFFRDTPVVVDLDALDGETETLDGKALVACIRRHRLEPIVASVGDKSSPLARTITLPLVEGGARGSATRRDASDTPPGAAEGPVDEASDGASRRPENGGGEGDATRDSAGAGSGGAAREASDAASAAADADAPLVAAPREIDYVVRTPMLVDRPVRSGQQIYARDTDLTVVGQVGFGAEVIADNNIHVYGPLRGRALCGVTGDTRARIFCQSLEAELVSVAGNYRMLETIPEALRGRPAQIRLDGDRLAIEPL